jgi:hypothetical protein
MNPRTHLEETCRHCVNGLRMGLDGVVRTCGECNGTTRHRRGLHDAESAVDYEPASRVAVRYGLLRELEARHPNDADLGAAVRALLGGERCSSR